MRTLRFRAKFVACLIFAVGMGAAVNARSEPCWPGAPAQEAAEADKKQILNVISRMTAGSGDFAPHFHPSVAEVKSMKKELVVK